MKATQADPTHGRIDMDIQKYVDEMKPKSLAQRVAIENTIQDHRDRRMGLTGSDS